MPGIESFRQANHFGKQIIPASKSFRQTNHFGKQRKHYLLPINRVKPVVFFLYTLILENLSLN